MNKSNKKVLIISTVLLALATLITVVCSAVKTQDDIADMLRKELQLTEEEASRLSYVGEFTDNDDSLLWFTIQDGISHMNRYFAVECRVVANGRYLVRGISDGGSWGADVSHAFLGKKDIILINNPSCRSIIFMTMGGNEVSRIEISPDDIPYIFELEQPARSTQIRFADAEGNEVR